MSIDDEAGHTHQVGAEAVSTYFNKAHDDRSNAKLATVVSLEKIVKLFGLKDPAPNHRAEIIQFKRKA